MLLISIGIAAGLSLEEKKSAVFRIVYIHTTLTILKKENNTFNR